MIASIEVEPETLSTTWSSASKTPSVGASSVLLWSYLLLTVFALLFAMTADANAVMSLRNSWS